MKKYADRELRRMIIKYRKHPEKYVEDFFGIKLYDFQKEIINNSVKENNIHE